VNGPRVEELRLEICDRPRFAAAAAVRTAVVSEIRYTRGVTKRRGGDRGGERERERDGRKEREEGGAKSAPVAQNTSERRVSRVADLQGDRAADGAVETPRRRARVLADLCDVTRATTVRAIGSRPHASQPRAQGSQRLDDVARLNASHSPFVMKKNLYRKER